MDAIVLSLNGDFADIVRYPPLQYKGIVALQIKNHPEVTEQAEYPHSEQYEGKLFLVEAHRIRLRR